MVSFEFPEAIRLSIEICSIGLLLNIISSFPILFPMISSTFSSDFFPLFCFPLSFLSSRATFDLLLKSFLPIVSLSELSIWLPFKMKDSWTGSLFSFLLRLGRILRLRPWTILEKSKKFFWFSTYFPKKQKK